MRVSSTIQAAHIDNGLAREITMKASSDAADQAAMLSAMTNLYSDPAAAVYREIPCNAADSHAAAGQTRPFEVTLPTTGSPFFVCQDYGTGMSSHDVEYIYSLFGRSTKRDSDTETGMLGFGCKAPLTFCLSFNGEAVKDGIRTSFVVTKNERGVGTIKILSESPTDKPNGMKITVPVPPDKVHTFAEGARQFFRYWRGGVVVRNGEDDDFTEPERLESTTWLDPDVAVLGRSGRSYVVMGNVPYPYDTRDDLPATCTWLEMNYGTSEEPYEPIDFVPSREALHHTERTDETLASIRAFIKTSLDRTVEARIKACPNDYERIRTISDIREQMPYRYQHPLLTQNELQFKSKGDGRAMWLVHGDRSAQDWVRDQWITTGRYNFVTDFPFKRVANLHRDMIDAVGIREPYIVIPENPGFSTFGFPGRSWKNIPPLPKKERVRVEERPLFREETKYTFFIAGTHTETPTYDGSLPVLYECRGDVGAMYLSNKYPVAAATIKMNQVDRFCRLHPGAVEWREYVTSIARRANGYLTKEDRRYLNSKPWERTLSNHFGEVVKQVKDKTLRQYMDLTTSEHLDTLMDIADRFDGNILRDVMKPDDFTAYASHRRTSWDDNRPPGDSYIAVNYPMLGGGNYTGFFDFMTRVDVEEWLYYLNGRWPTVKANLKTLAESDTDDNDNDQAAA